LKIFNTFIYLKKELKNELEGIIKSVIYCAICREYKFDPNIIYSLLDTPFVSIAKLFLYNGACLPKHTKENNGFEDIELSEKDDNITVETYLKSELWLYTIKDIIDENQIIVASPQHNIIKKDIDYKCIICKQKGRTVLFIPCQHLIICPVCCDIIKPIQCFECHNDIENTIQLFKQ